MMSGVALTLLRLQFNSLRWLLQGVDVWLVTVTDDVNYRTTISEHGNYRNNKGTINPISASSVFLGKWGIPDLGSCTLVT